MHAQTQVKLDSRHEAAQEYLAIRYDTGTSMREIHETYEHSMRLQQMDHTTVLRCRDNPPLSSGIYMAMYIITSDHFMPLHNCQVSVNPLDVSPREADPE